MKHIYALLIIISGLGFYFFLRQATGVFDQEGDAVAIAEVFMDKYFLLNIYNTFVGLILMVLSNIIHYRAHKGIYFFYSAIVITTFFVLSQVIAYEQYQVFRAETGLSTGGYTWTKVYAFIAALIIIFINGFNYFILYAIKKRRQGDFPEEDIC